MKKLLLLACLFLTACGVESTAQAQAIHSAFPSSAPVPTSTPIPTSTIGYQSTADYWQNVAVYAQQTADGYSRLNVDATMNANQMTHEMDMLTVVAGQQTGTAEATVIPITLTYSADMFTANAAQLTANADEHHYALAAMTATEHAPTQIVAAARAQTEVWAAPWLALAQIAAMFGLGVFMVGLGAFAWRFNGKKKLEPKEETEEENPLDKYTPIALETNVNNFPSVDYMLIPCTPEQLTELANGLLNEGKTMALRHWETAESSLNRNVIYPVRNFLRANHMAVAAARGDMVLTATGEAFFRAWLENGTPPPSYSFAPDIETNGWKGALVGENLIQENGRGGLEGVGEVVLDAPAPSRGMGVTAHDTH